MAHYISLRPECIRLPDARLYDIVQEDAQGPVFDDVELLIMVNATVIYIIGTTECYIITKKKDYEKIKPKVFNSAAPPAPVPVAPVEKRNGNQTALDF